MYKLSVESFHLPHISTPLDQIIAWRGNTPISNQTFQSRLHAWITLFQHQTYEKFALHLNDSLEFAAALFGAWFTRKIIYLPNNLLPQTLSNLKNSVDKFICHPGHGWPEPSARDGKTHPCHPISDKAIADYEGLILYTSGSTGEPKLIPKRLSQLASEVFTLEKLFGEQLGCDAEIIATVSHEHIYGLLFKILWPLSAGRVIHLNNITLPGEFIPLLTNRPSVLISSPAHLKRLPKKSNLNTYSIRAIFSSAGNLSWEAWQDCHRILGNIPFEIYGSTETGGIAWRQRKQLQDTNFQALPGVEWRISTEKNILEIRSPHLSNDQWFSTDDHVRALSDQHFILEGRTDRIVKLEGKRISLDMIEQQLKQTSLIRETKIFMLEKNHSRQVIAAFIVLSPEGRSLLTEWGKIKFNQHLRQSLASSVENIALPRLFRYLDQLPTNTQGKTTTAELMALLEAPTLPNATLIEKNEQQIILQLTIPHNLRYFEGHFNEAPILPGVVQIHWAIFYARQYFDLPPHFSGMQKLKFQKVIQPDAIVHLALFYIKEKSLLNFSLHSKVGQHASGTLLFSTGLSNV